MHTHTHTHTHTTHTAPHTPSVHSVNWVVTYSMSCHEYSYPGISQLLTAPVTTPTRSPPIHPVCTACLHVFFLSFFLPHPRPPPPPRDTPTPPHPHTHRPQHRTLEHEAEAAQSSTVRAPPLTPTHGLSPFFLSTTVGLQHKKHKT